MKEEVKTVFESLEAFPLQLDQISKTVANAEINIQADEIDNVVLCGVGGSSFGAHIALEFGKEFLMKPLYINSDYKLPNFVTDRTLVFVTSYSGDTEEVLHAYEEAKEKKARIVGLTAGGKLAKSLKQDGFPFVQFEVGHNPSGKPRFGNGYIVLGTLEILSRIGVLNQKFDVKEIIKYLEESKESAKQEAKSLATQIYKKTPLILTADFLNGNGRILRNQINETAKSLSAHYSYPDLNHHLMEGLKNPQENRTVAVVLVSDHYSNNMKKRIELTETVLKKNNVEVLEYNSHAPSKILDVFKVLLFGGYLGYELALLYGEDPSTIPWVDYFKEELSKVR